MIKQCFTGVNRHDSMHARERNNHRSHNIQQSKKMMMNTAVLISLLISLSSAQLSPAPSPGSSSLSLFPSAGASFAHLYPDSKCLSARVVGLDTPTALAMDQTYTDTTLLCKVDGGPWFDEDYYKSEYIRVRGTGGVLQVSTCNEGSSVDSRVSIYSKCLDSDSCINAKYSGDPNGYDYVCQQSCVATSETSCGGGGGGGSEVSWSTEKGKWYFIQVWQNRRSWGPHHQRYYTPVPCPGTVVVTVLATTAGPPLRRSVKAVTNGPQTAMHRVGGRTEKRKLYGNYEQLDQLYWYGYEEIPANGQPLTSSTEAQPSVLYGNDYDPFCPADMEASLPGKWFTIGYTSGPSRPRIICLSGSDNLGSASIFVVGNLFEIDFGYSGCLPDAEPITIDGCAVATKFYYTGDEYAIMVQTQEPVSSFDIAILDAPDECAASSSSPSSSPSVQVNSIDRPVNCGELRGCLLENLDTGDEVELEDGLVYEPRNFSYSVRCDVAGGDLEQMDFAYDGETHTERLEPWYLNGNSGEKVNKESYLKSCGDKVIEVVGSVKAGICFENTISFHATGC